MIATRQRFYILLITAGIVVSALISACGAGNESTNKATDGTTIIASAPSNSFIYISTTANTNKQSNLKFTVSKNGTPLANVGVTVTLDPQSLTAGVTFFGGGTTLNLITDTKGDTPSFSVVAGGIPTSIIVKGALANNLSVADYSSSIAVSSGAADQDRFSIGLSKLSIEGWNYLGETSSVTIQVADRLGNPVPDGTRVNFTAGPGVIASPPSCVTSASSCSVNLITADAVGKSPLVTILAFGAGEESFVDSNGNNRYDAGELFTDLGQPYRDDNQDSAYAPNNDQAISAVGTGTNACPATPYSIHNSVPNTCNGVRDSIAVVRASTVLYVAPSNPVLNLIGSTSASKTFELYVQIAGATAKYRAPSGSTVTAQVVVTANTSSTCAVTMDNTAITSNAANATITTTHTLIYTPANCAGQQARVTATTPKGNSVNFAVNL